MPYFHPLSWTVLFISTFQKDKATSSRITATLQTRSFKYQRAVTLPVNTGEKKEFIACFMILQGSGCKKLGVLSCVNLKAADKIKKHSKAILMPWWHHYRADKVQRTAMIWEGGCGGLSDEGPIRGADFTPLLRHVCRLHLLTRIQPGVTLSTRHIRICVPPCHSPLPHNASPPAHTHTHMHTPSIPHTYPKMSDGRQENHVDNNLCCVPRTPPFNAGLSRHRHAAWTPARTCPHPQEMRKKKTDGKRWGELKRRGKERERDENLRGVGRAFWRRQGVEAVAMETPPCLYWVIE